MTSENRREFLKKSGCALSMAALATQARHFGMMTAMAQTVDEKASVSSSAPSDYRALVCILMAGGNDGNNLMVPRHSDATISNYQVYASARSAQGLAIPQNQLLPVTVPRLSNLSYGFNPNLGAVPQQGGINNGIHELWAQGKLAVVTNTGNLIRPMTKTQFQQNPAWRPFQLFSHSDQAAQQQTSRSDGPSPLGWAGKIADRTTVANNPNGLVPMITSIAGTPLFTLGQTTTPLAMSDATTPLNETLVLYSSNGTDPFTIARKNAVIGMRTVDLDSALVAAASNITNQAQSASVALSTYQEVTATFPNTDLGNQLKQVARIIKKRNDLSVNRQVFFVELGGFDTHQNQLQGGNSQTALLAQLSQAMRAFYDEMGSQGIQDKVTQFTLSDFGRTLNPAGIGSIVGSDHAWGNHMMVLGGSVIGGNIYGSTRPDGTGNFFPTLQLGGPDDVDTGTSPRGRWLPTTSVEQYAATLGRWFGLTDTDIPVIFPNIVNFPSSNLGFMTA
jgi:uncharacterized protein (DUF1501 family)